MDIAAKRIPPPARTETARVVVDLMDMIFSFVF
jgi:hypothetical protein